jgi:hypothetical protein
MELPQLAECARLATPLARFGEVGRAASKQRVGGSGPCGCATPVDGYSTQDGELISSVAIPRRHPALMIVERILYRSHAGRKMGPFGP